MFSEVNKFFRQAYQNNFKLAININFNFILP